METGVSASTAAAAAAAPLEQLLNGTITTTTAANGTAPGELYTNSRRMILGIVVMCLGVIGNLLALIILARKKHNKNSKYTFMLR